MFIDDLTETDYSILEFVKNNEPVSLADILQGMPNVATLEYRIKLLSSPEYHQSIPFFKDNSSCLEEEFECIESLEGYNEYVGLKIYTLTDMGGKALQDYHIKTKRRCREMWLKNAWIPILVSLATNLVINVIKRLLPLIQVWVSSFL